MAVDAEQEELIFFDTFAHDASEDLYLDLVQFPKPVVISQVRVIPLGARVQADFPGGVRLGATNPSSFHIEFFINDLSKPGASAFESLGVLDYKQTSAIHIECQPQVPTDGLVLRGLYTTITLAIYGHLSKVVPPPPPQAPIQDSHNDDRSSTAATAEWVHSQQAIFRDSYAYPPTDGYGGPWPVQPQPPPVPAGGDTYNQDWSRPASPPGAPDEKSDDRPEYWDDSKRFKDRDRKDMDRQASEGWREPDRSRSQRDCSWERESSPYSDHRRRPRSPARRSPKRPSTPSERFSSPDKRGRPHSPRPPSPKPLPGHLHLDGNTNSPQTPLHSPPPPARPDHRGLEEEFEPILSDDDIPDDNDSQYADLDYDTPDDLEEVVKPFNTYNFNMTPLMNISDPCCTSYEIAKKSGGCLDACKTVKHLIESTELSSTDQLLTSAEQVLPLLADAMVHESWTKGDSEALHKWTLFGLDFNAGLAHTAPGSKIRHFKAGIRLVHLLAHCGCAAQMVEQGVQEDLLCLFHKEYMSLSLRLLILQALDATLLDEEGLQRLTTFKWTAAWNDCNDLPATTYQHLLLMLKVKQQVRIKFAITSILQKVHLDEVVDKLCNETTGLDVTSVLSYLEAIRRLYTIAKHELAQPARFLPVSAQFDVKIDNKSAYLFIYRCFRRYKLFSTIQALLNSKNNAVLTTTCDLLRTLTASRQGLTFLACSQECTSLLSVLQTLDDTLGVELPCRLMTLTCLDKLAGSKEDDVIFNTLHDLYSVTYTGIGKSEVARTLAEKDGVETLLRIAENINVKSVIRSYIADLCELSVKYSEDSAHLRTYVKELNGLFDVEGKSINTLSYLKPLEIKQDMNVLCEILKKYTALEFTGCFDGELITAVREIKNLCIFDTNLPDSLTNEFVIYHQLKHKHAILQFYTADGLMYISTLLSKMYAYYEQPYTQTSSLVGSQGYNIVSFCAPAVILMRTILTHLIEARGSDYKDLTHVNILVELFILMKAVPVSSEASMLSQSVCRNVVETLLVYTDPAVQTENYSKSLWTLMVADVVRMIIKAPFCFLSGLKLLSELLPLPLPMQAKDILTEEQVAEIRSARQLWSAYMHPLAGPLHDLFATLTTASHPPLLQILRRVAVQLADLAPPTAVIVTRAILDPIIATLSNPDGGWQMPVSQHACRLLNFLTSVTLYPAIKAAVLSLLAPGPAVKADDKLSTLVDAFLLILRTTTPPGTPAYVEKTQVQAQECVLLILQSLVDIDVSLVPVSGDPARLANALPSRDTLASIVSSLFDHISSPAHPLPCILFALKPLIFITDHDFGFYRIKHAVETHRDAIYQLLSRLNNVMARDYNDGFNILHAMLALLREFVLDAPTPMRTLTLTRHELARLLKWGQLDHPLLSIHDKLKDWSAKNESLGNLCESAGDLLKLLGSSDPDSAPPSSKDEEPLVPPPMTFMEQFAVRPIIVNNSDPDPKTLTSSYWLGLSGPEDADVEEQIPCDLMDLCSNFLPDLDLVTEVQKVCRVRTTDVDVKKSGHAKYQLSSTRTRKPFVTPMRGRGSRPPPSRGDTFRSRPPNTSRPPSLHVDDFVALETCGQQPTGPTGYNKVSVRNVKDVIGNRGRGRGRGFSSSPYSRRGSGDGRAGRGRTNWVPETSRYRTWQTDDLRRIHPFPR